MEIGEKVKRLMEKRGITAYRLAKEANVSYTGLSKLLNGSTKNPQTETLSAIADILHVSSDYLLGRGEIYEIGWAIKEEREEQGLTTKELGESIGVDEQEIIAYESDETPISLQFAEKIADVFGMSYVAFLDKYNLYDEYIPPHFNGDADSYENFKKSVDRDAQSGNAPYPLNPKEERDIAIDLERMLSDLESDQALAFHGEALDDESKELLRISLENSLRLAKQMAKQKFTPKKHRK